jgi:histidinol-phosphate aminotransferase
MGMSDPTQLLREDLRDFAGYASARRACGRGDVWLNANESAIANASDAAGALRRYPEPQPAALVRALADLYDVPAACVLACRGSDEAIDLLVRAFCAPGRDAIAIAPPVFGMYAVSARLHGARVVEVPARDDGETFAVDLPVLAQVARARGVRLAFLCSPGNPTGELLDRDAVIAFAQSLAGQAVVVVDEAYIEYADVPSLAARVLDTPNLVVLRTLSKAHALAGARIGCAIADPRIVASLARCQAPYPISASSCAAALDALAPSARARSRQAAADVRVERNRLRSALTPLQCVRQVLRSDANFLLVRFHDAPLAWERLIDAGIVVRDMRADPRLQDALRITVGSPEQNARLLEALG